MALPHEVNDVDDGADPVVTCETCEFGMEIETKDGSWSIYQCMSVGYDTAHRIFGGEFTCGEGV